VSVAAGTAPSSGATAEALAAATDALVAVGVPEARLDAELLLAHASGRGRASLIADPGAELPPAVGRRFGELVRRRAEPAQVPGEAGQHSQQRGALPGEVLLELPAHLVEAGRGPQDAWADRGAQAGQHGIVVLALERHPYQALPGRGQQQRADRGVQGPVADVQHAVPLGGVGQPGVQPGQRLPLIGGQRGEQSGGVVGAGLECGHHHFTPSVLRAGR